MVIVIALIIVCIKLASETAQYAERTHTLPSGGIQGTASRIKGRSETVKAIPLQFHNLQLPIIPSCKAGSAK